MDLIAFFTDMQNLLSIAVGVLVFATLVTVFGSMTQGAQLEGRMKAVAVRREELRRRSREAIVRNTQGGLRHTDDGFKKRVVERLNLTKLLEDPKVADKMAQAGFRGPRPLTTFYFFRFATPFVFLSVAIFYFYVLGVMDLPSMSRLALTVMAAGIGFYAPNLYLENRIAKRKTSIMQAFPDALDLMLICVESGMSVDAAIAKVSQEIGGRSIELAEELSQLSAELSYLPDRRLAYEGMS